MLVGEQRRRRIQEGPALRRAGRRLLDRALAAAGVDRNDLYVHQHGEALKWQLRGKRRLHKTPAQREVDACRQWLEHEIAR